ncbi:hypothetical protein [Alicyclobacillus fastidiosus]|uniref:Uncharacterized protein n=1 Tax=Alicyclobacillus fastidiosus TaxID=392011 RepID=A0ABV5AB26_9BACL|nr:hypothetical protein [Alicyclobacillus fastidiosus]WEH10956.1 hypothetical protein PYS47_06995 [Alicyclobacillus fastidiosus]
MGIRDGLTFEQRLSELERNVSHIYSAVIPSLLREIDYLTAQNRQLKQLMPTEDYLKLRLHVGTKFDSASLQSPIDQLRDNGPVRNAYQGT